MALSFQKRKRKIKQYNLFFSYSIASFYLFLLKLRQKRALPSRVSQDLLWIKRIISKSLKLTSEQLLRSLLKCLK